MPDNRRAPAEPRTIDSINPRDDIRVRVTGTVIEKDEDTILLDDGTGSIDVFLDQEDIEALDENDRVRILGRVLPTPDSFEIQGEIIQDANDLDMDLYNDVQQHVSH
ncbi:MAG: OB-fold nucleic acid binding domain-containing protein [Candidatus Nanohaloarchaea archaeon]|nr:OB-fold nucleic acid binding domain-containing protein [Candidatus Nanohaloarchaea archaeon]